MDLNKEIDISYIDFEEISFDERKIYVSPEKFIELVKKVGPDAVFVKEINNFDEARCFPINVHPDLLAPIIPMVLQKYVLKTGELDFWSRGLSLCFKMKRFVLPYNGVFVETKMPFESIADAIEAHREEVSIFTYYLKKLLGFDKRLCEFALGYGIFDEKLLKDFIRLESEARNAGFFSVARYLFLKEVGLSENDLVDVLYIIKEFLNIPYHPTSELKKNISELKAKLEKILKLLFPKTFNRDVLNFVDFFIYDLPNYLKRLKEGFSNNVFIREYIYYDGEKFDIFLSDFPTDISPSKIDVETNMFKMLLREIGEKKKKGFKDVIEVVLSTILNTDSLEEVREFRRFLESKIRENLDVKVLVKLLKEEKLEEYAKTYRFSENI